MKRITVTSTRSSYSQLFSSAYLTELKHTLLCAILVLTEEWHFWLYFVVSSVLIMCSIDVTKKRFTLDCRWKEARITQNYFGEFENQLHNPSLKWTSFIYNVSRNRAQLCMDLQFLVHTSLFSQTPNVTLIVVIWTS